MVPLENRPSVWSPKQEIMTRNQTKFVGTSSFKLVPLKMNPFVQCLSYCGFFYIISFELDSGFLLKDSEIRRPTGKMF